MSLRIGGPVRRVFFWTWRKGDRKSHQPPPPLFDLAALWSVKRGMTTSCQHRQYHQPSEVEAEYIWSQWINNSGSFESLARLVCVCVCIFRVFLFTHQRCRPHLSLTIVNNITINVNGWTLFPPQSETTHL